jgi:threonine aldolase
VAAAQNAAAVRTPTDTTVRLTGDGLGLTTGQYSHVLAGLADRGIAEDDYVRGGVVEELESRMATLLGKERAVFMPTGTLANNLAIRTLAGGHGRAVVQAESHIYLDSGDCVQTLSYITLLPLGEGRASFTAEELERLLEKNGTGRVATPVRVVSIESPVRRMRGQTFEPAELIRWSRWARKAGVRLTPRRRAAVPRGGLRAKGRGGVREAVRYRVRLLVQVFQRLVRGHPGRPA